MARPKGTTRAKKAIGKFEFEKLIAFTKRTSCLQQQRARVKLIRAYTLLYVTGCRISEIIDFQTKDLQKIIENKEYSLTNDTKTDTPRLIILSDQQIELIKSITPHENIKLFDVSIGYLTIKANNVIHKCLGDLYSSHSFRAGYITRLANNGANAKLIQEDIGHAKVETTMRYIKVTDEDKRKAKEKLSW